MHCVSDFHVKGISIRVESTSKQKEMTSLHVWEEKEAKEVWSPSLLLF